MPAVPKFPNPDEALPARRSAGNKLGAAFQRAGGQQPPRGPTAANTDGREARAARASAEGHGDGRGDSAGGAARPGAPAPGAPPTRADLL